jgi:hypothetical protein
MGFCMYLTHYNTRPARVAVSYLDTVGKERRNSFLDEMNYHFDKACTLKREGILMPSVTIGQSDSPAGF